MRSWRGPTSWVIGFCLVWACLTGVESAQLPPQAAEEFQRAVQFFRAGDFRSSSQLLSDLEKRFPDTFDVQHLLALVLDMSGRSEEATRHFERAVEIEPGSAQARTNYGTHLMRLGRMDEAVRQFEESARLQPELGTAAFNLGTIFLKRQQFAEAEKWLRDAQALRPKVYENGYQLAFCYFLQGKHREAEKVLNELTAVPLERGEYYLLRAVNDRALGRSGNVSNVVRDLLPVLTQSPESAAQVVALLLSQDLAADAALVLGRSAELFPDSWETWLQLARVRLESSDLSGARQAAGKALALRETAEARLLLGDIAEAEDDPVQAVKHYQNALELDRNETTFFALGYEFLTHWNWEAAHAVFAQGLESFPDSSSLWLGLGGVHLGENRKKEATRAFMEAARLAPREILPYEMLSRSFDESGEEFARAVERFREFHEANPGQPWAGYLHALGQFQTALRNGKALDSESVVSLLDQAIAGKSDFFEAHRLLGEVRFHENDWKNAIASFEKALEVNPEDVETHYKLALSLQRNGDRDQAREVMSRYQELKKSQDEAMAERVGRTKRLIVEMKRPR